MTDVIMTRRGATKLAAQMAADGDDTRFLADEQSAWADEIEQVTRLVWDEGCDVDEAVEQVLGSDDDDWCPLCGTSHEEGHGPAGYSCEAGR